MAFDSPTVIVFEDDIIGPAPIFKAAVTKLYVKDEDALKSIIYSSCTVALLLIVLIAPERTIEVVTLFLSSDDIHPSPLFITKVPSFRGTKDFSSKLFVFKLSEPIGFPYSSVCILIISS